MSWLKRIGLGGSSHTRRVPRGTSWDRISDDGLIDPQFAETGTDWDSISDEALAAMAKVERDMREHREKAERQGRAPYPRSHIYDGAENALAIRSRWLHEQGITKFAYDHLKVPLSEYARWKPMLLRESGEVSPYSEVTAETAMRIAIFADRLFHEKLIACGVPKELADAFRVECGSERESHIHSAREIKERKDLHPLMVVNPSKLRAGLETLGETDKAKAVKFLSSALYNLDIHGFTRERIFSEEHYSPIPTENGEINTYAEGMGRRGYFNLSYEKWMRSLEKFAHDFGAPLEFNMDYLATVRSEIAYRKQQREKDPRPIQNQWIISSTPLTLTIGAQPTASGTLPGR